MIEIHSKELPLHDQKSTSKLSPTAMLCCLVLLSSASNILPQLILVVYPASIFPGSITNSIQRIPKPSWDTGYWPHVSKQMFCFGVTLICPWFWNDTRFILAKTHFWQKTWVFVAHCTCHQENWHWSFFHFGSKKLCPWWLYTGKLVLLI